MVPLPEVGACALEIYFRISISINKRDREIELERERERERDSSFEKRRWRLSGRELYLGRPRLPEAENGGSRNEKSERTPPARCGQPWDPHNPPPCWGRRCPWYHCPGPLRARWRVIQDIWFLDPSAVRLRGQNLNLRFMYVLSTFMYVYQRLPNAENRGSEN